MIFVVFIISPCSGFVTFRKYLNSQKLHAHEKFVLLIDISYLLTKLLFSQEMLDDNDHYHENCKDCPNTHLPTHPFLLNHHIDPLILLA